MTEANWVGDFDKFAKKVKDSDWVDRYLFEVRS